MTEPATPGEGGLRRLGRWCARHSWVVIALWLLALGGTYLGSLELNASYSNDYNLPGSAAQQGVDLLRAHEPAAGEDTSQIVFTVSRGQLSSDRDAIETALSHLAHTRHVRSATDPFTTGTVSANGQVAYTTVQFDGNPTTLGSGFVTDIGKATDPARAAGVSVQYGGDLGQAARPVDSDLTSEVIGIGIAVLVLLLGFGSVLGAGIPIAAAMISVGTGVSLLGLAAAVVTFSSTAPTLATMMGLGVGIDYALFLTTRHRQRLIDGADPADAAADTVASSGRAVLIAACTVAVALYGLYASGIVFIGKLGLASAIGVTVSALAAVTLVPALLGLAGRRIDRLRVRHPIAEPHQDNGFWQRYTASVGRHPWRYLLGGLLVAAILAIPVLSMRLGYIDASAEPAGYPDRQAYESITRGFGVGANGPLTIVVAPAGPADESTVESALYQALKSTPGVAAVTPVQPTPDHALLVTTVIPTTSPHDLATDTLDNTLQNHTLPTALAPYHAHGYVTGPTAGQLNFRDKVAHNLPAIFVVVIAAALILLLASFRSVLVAVKAALLNLVSIGAAYGVVVAVFQWGWGASLLGLPETVPVESYVPMMMFAIVFGLSMDYEVFLVSRIRETWLATHDNARAVATGIAATARVIGCAAIIMTSVFLAFLLSTDIVIKMLALGLGVSVIIDATLIRLIVVPAAMFLMDKANWWMPRWLDRILPSLEHRSPPQAVADSEPDHQSEPEPARR
jgi:putative drug exporter of the RND superfamily